MIEKIVNIYESILPKQPIMLPHSEAIDYFKRLYMNGNIITMVDDNELIGFLEYWRINTEQFGRICCNMTLAHDEDLLNGDICLITRMWIMPDHRMGKVFIAMAINLLAQNNTAKYFAAMQFQKRHKPIQVYPREQILKHYRMEK